MYVVRMYLMHFFMSLNVVKLNVKDESWSKGLILENIFYLRE